MILQPIQQQRVLPTQFNQQVLPAITCDTTQIRRQIEQMYNRTIILPETHSVEVKNYIETPQGLIQQPTPSLGQQTQQLLPTPSLTMPSQVYSTQPIVNQSLNPQLLPRTSTTIPSQVYSTQSIVNQSLNPQLLARTPTTYQSIVPRPMIMPANNTQLLYNRLLPNQSFYANSVPLYNSLSLPSRI